MSRGEREKLWTGGSNVSIKQHPIVEDVIHVEGEFQAVEYRFPREREPKTGIQDQ